MRRRLPSLCLLLLVPALAACWESKMPVYHSTDFHVREDGEIITISDHHGPLGLYLATGSNRYEPIFTEAEPNTREFLFRKLRIGVVPVDRILANTQAGFWASERRHSRAILPDSDALLLILVIQQERAAAQSFAVAYVEGNRLAICEDLLQPGSSFHDQFQEVTQGEASTVNQKRAVANLAFYEVGAAKSRGEFRCDNYRIESHTEDDFTSLIQAIELGDKRRRGNPSNRLNNTIPSVPDTPSRLQQSIDQR